MQSDLMGDFGRAEEDLNERRLREVSAMSKEEIIEILKSIFRDGGFEIGENGKIIFVDDEIDSLTPIEKQFIKAAQRRLSVIYRQ
jgi:hypothetical protein